MLKETETEETSHFFHNGGISIGRVGGPPGYAYESIHTLKTSLHSALFIGAFFVMCSMYV